MKLLSSLLLLLAFTTSWGCYSRRSIIPEELTKIEEPVICEIVLDNAKVVRAQVLPGHASSQKIICQPCVFDGGSWEIQYSGWPAVYSSGKFWRPAHHSEKLEFETKEIRALYREEVSWFPTILTLPVTLPVGIIDAFARHAQLSFEKITSSSNDDDSWDNR